MIQSAKKVVFGHFLDLGLLDRLDIAYDDRNKFQHLGTLIAYEGSYKRVKNALLNDPKCQKRGFLDLGLMDRLDIAYDERTICFPTFGNTTRS